MSKCSVGGQEYHREKVEWCGYEKMVEHIHELRRMTDTAIPGKSRTGRA